MDAVAGERHSLNAPHSLFLKSTIKRISAHEPTPRDLIKIFDGSEDPMSSARSRLEKQEGVALNWNNYELTVTLKIMNPDFLRNCSDSAVFNEQKLGPIFAQKLNLQVKANSKVAQVKERIEAEIRPMLPHGLIIDIIELRIGERLSLPNTADLAQLIQHSAQPVIAMVQLADKEGGIKTQEFAFKDTKTVITKHHNQAQTAHTLYNSKSTLQQSVESLRNVILGNAKPKVITN